MKTRIQRSGRVLSAENEAHIKAAIDHCQKVIDCLQAVLDSSTEVAARRLERQWSHAPLQ